MGRVRTGTFNQAGRPTEGWYWVLPARDLPRGRPRAVSLMGRELVLLRGTDGRARAHDAYCPHMGCHLALGKLRGDALQCFFHGWRFGGDGSCVHVPAIGGPPRKPVRLRTWHVRERHGLIWLWVGDGEPADDIPLPPGLAGEPVVARVGKPFAKGCHPNVVMVNAIDEHHFRTVHRLPGEILSLRAEVRDSRSIAFLNRRGVPRRGWLSALLSHFYRGRLTYDLCYWYGSTGAVSFGPDFLPIHLMFALRPTPEGRTEGVTIALTRRRRGWSGALANRLVLWLSAVGAKYFAHGDTRVFENIRFDLRTPVAADRSVIAFMRHVERQKTVSWWGDETSGCDSRRPGGTGLAVDVHAEAVS